MRVIIQKARSRHQPFILSLFTIKKNVSKNPAKTKTILKTIANAKYDSTREANVHIELKINIIPMSNGTHQFFTFFLMLLIN